MRFCGGVKGDDMKTLEERIIPLLFEGYNQYEIAAILKQEGIKPFSLSSVEKELKMIRKVYGAKTMFHLGSILTRKKILNGGK